MLKISTAIFTTPNIFSTPIHGSYKTFFNWGEETTFGNGPGTTIFRCKQPTAGEISAKRQTYSVERYLKIGILTQGTVYRIREFGGPCMTSSECETSGAPYV